MIPILIVEDSPVVRRALREMLASIDGAAVVGEFDRPAPAIERIRRQPPQVVVLGIQLVGGSGLELLRVVGNEHPQVKVMVFTNFAEPVYRNAWTREPMPFATRTATCRHCGAACRVWSRHLAAQARCHWQRPQADAATAVI